MQIDLLRHGEYEGEKVYCGITDRKLTDFGWKQMQDACETKNDWELIISSPLSRCSAFARQLSEQLRIPLLIDKRWQEMNFGQWDGLTALEIMSTHEQHLTDFWSDPAAHAPPDGESLQQVHTRVLQAWYELTRQEKSTLVITHGGPMRIIHCHHNNSPLEKILDINVQYAEIFSFAKEMGL